MMARWITIIDKEKLTPDTGVCALVNGQQVALFWDKLTDTFFAIGNYDPMGKANVLSRGLIGDIKGELVVASPLYKHHYKLTSGQCIEDPEVEVPVYPIRVADGQVQIAA